MIWFYKAIMAIFHVYVLFVFIFRYYISLGAIVDRFGGDLNSTPLHWATRYVD